MKFETKKRFRTHYIDQLNDYFNETNNLISISSDKANFTFTTYDYFLYSLALIVTKDRKNILRGRKIFSMLFSDKKGWLPSSLWSNHHVPSYQITNVIFRFNSFISKLPSCLLGEELNTIYAVWLNNVQLDRLEYRENHLTNCLRYVEISESTHDIDICEMSIDQINDLYFLMLVDVVGCNSKFLKDMAFCHTRKYYLPMLSTNTHTKSGAGISTLYQLMKMNSANSELLENVSLKLKLQYIISTSDFRNEIKESEYGYAMNHTGFDKTLHHGDLFSALWKPNSSDRNDGLFYLTTNHDTSPLQLTIINKADISTVKRLDGQTNELSWLMTFEEQEAIEPFSPFEVIYNDSDVIEAIPAVIKMNEPFCFRMSEFNLELELKEESGDSLCGSYFRHQRSSDFDKKWLLFMRCLGEKLPTKYTLRVTCKMR
jgi:hypothetical protein